MYKVKGPFILVKVAGSIAKILPNFLSVSDLLPLLYVTTQTQLDVH